MEFDPSEPVLLVTALAVLALALRPKLFNLFGVSSLAGAVLYKAVEFALYPFNVS
jgi:hypothetical protein